MAELKNMDVRVVYRTPAGERKELLVATPVTGKPPAPSLAVNVHGLKDKMSIAHAGGEGAAVQALIKRQLGAAVASRVQYMQLLSNQTDADKPDQEATAVYMADLGELTEEQARELTTKVSEDLKDAMVFTGSIGAPAGVAADAAYVGSTLGRRFDTGPGQIDKAAFRRLRQEAMERNKPFDQLLEVNMVKRERGESPLSQDLARQADGSYQPVARGKETPQLHGNIVEQYANLRRQAQEVDAILQRANVPVRKNLERTAEVDAFLSTNARASLLGMPPAAYRARLEAVTQARDSGDVPDRALFNNLRSRLVTQYNTVPPGSPATTLTERDKFLNREYAKFLEARFGYPSQASSEAEARKHFLEEQKRLDIERWRANPKHFPIVRGADFSYQDRLDLHGDKLEKLTQIQLEKLWDEQARATAEERFEALNDMHNGITTAAEFAGNYPAVIGDTRLAFEARRDVEKAWNTKLDKDAMRMTRIELQVDAFEAQRTVYITKATTGPDAVDRVTAQAKFDAEKVNLRTQLEEIEKTKDQLLINQKDMVPKAPQPGMSAEDRAANRKKEEDLKVFTQAMILQDLIAQYQRGLQQDEQGRVYDAEGNDILKDALKDTKGHWGQGDPLAAVVKVLKEMGPENAGIIAGMILDVIFLFKSGLRGPMLGPESTPADYALSSLIAHPKEFGLPAYELMAKMIKVDEKTGKATMDLSHADMEKGGARSGDKLILAAAFAVTRHGVKLEDIKFPNSELKTETEKLIKQLEMSRLKWMKDNGIKPDLHKMDKEEERLDAAKAARLGEPKAAVLEDPEAAARIVVPPRRP